MTAITSQLIRLREGDPSAQAELWALIYPWVLSHARNVKRGAPGNAAFDTLDIAQEAYVRAARLDQLDLQASAQLRAYVCSVVRSVLVDLGRRSRAEKRGGDVTLCVLDEAHGVRSSDCHDVLEVEDLLTQLAGADTTAAEVVSMKVYSGMENEEVALALGISRATVVRKWRFGRAWLVERLQRAASPE